MREIIGFRAMVWAIVRRHQVTTVVGALLACLLIDALIGQRLDDWVVAMGMDTQRASLIGAMLVVALVAALVVLFATNVKAARIGSFAGFVLIALVPFLITAMRARATPGLTVTVSIAGWILQPLGILLLGTISATVGVAIGERLRSDAAHVVTVLRLRHWSWPLVPVAVVLVALAGSAAVVGLQQGALGQLQSYGDATSPSKASNTSSGVQRWQAELQLPGDIQNRSVDGRQVLVYVPGIYAADPTRRLPVVYFLHGTPGAPQDWLASGGQLDGVLDQLIAEGVVPPVIGVAPDGNGPRGQDTEWGNNAQGDVESWLVQQVVPFIDGQYRTLGAGYRGIAGLSSGGYGAVNLALRNPNVFDWAASYSGYFSARQDIFGSAWRANSPRFTAPTLSPNQRMPLYLGWGADDRAFAAATVQFASEVRRLDWPVVDADEVSGGHGWEAWRAELVNSLKWLGRLWGNELPSAVSSTAPRKGAS